jgi:hypothetical protein
MITTPTVPGEPGQAPPVLAVGIVVMVGARRIAIKTPPGDVYVLNRDQLVPWLKAHTEILDDTTIAGVFDAARQSTTWTGTPRRRD